MNAHAKTIEPATETNAVALIEANPVVAFTDPEKFDAFYDKVAAEVRGHVPDLTTEKGRKAIASLAYKVARSKTALDDAGKALTEEKRAEIKKVDEARKAIRDKLDALKEEARKPLTDWEAAEEERVASVKATIQRLQDAAIVSIDDSAETVLDRLDTIQGVEITAEVFQEYEAAARAHLATATATLTAAAERLRREAEERAELERLRQEKAEREERERADAAIAQRAADMADFIKQVGLGFIGGQTYPFPILLRELEEKVVIDETYGARREELEQLRVTTLEEVKAGFERHLNREREETERAAADQARRDAEDKARAEHEARERKHADALAAEKRRADEAEAARKAEADRAAAEKAAAEREAEAQRKADAKRAADREHRGKVMGTAKAAIMAAGGVGEEAAKKIVLAIGAGEIPAVSIQF